MKFNPDDVPIRISRTHPVYIPLPGVNSEMINIQCNKENVPFEYKTGITRFSPTRSHGTKTDFRGLGEGGNNDKPSFYVPGSILDVHFTNDGRMIVLTNLYRLYIVDIENTTNTIVYQLCINTSIKDHEDKHCYLTSTDDGAIWVLDGPTCYVFKGLDTTVYSAGEYTICKENISHWGGNYLIGLLNLQKAKTYYALLGQKPFHCVATKQSQGIRRVLKWNNKLLLHGTSPSRLDTEMSIFLSLHEWNGDANFTRTHYAPFCMPVSSISMTHRTIVLANYRNAIDIYNEELQDILRLRTDGQIISACIHLNQLYVIEDSTNFNRSMPVPSGIIGPLLTVGGVANIKPEKLLPFDARHIRLITSLGFLFIVSKDGIYPSTGTWSKKANKLMSPHTRKSVTTLYTLQMIGVLKVPREILDSILVYAFSF